MQNIVVQYKKIFIILGGIILLPIVLILINSTVETIFNLGGYAGTFIRYLFNNVVC